MALPATQDDPKYLRGIVDMGSNGIRFSISSLQPPAARIMPTLYQQRAGISLYDAQYSASGEQQPIDNKTIEAVITAFRQFKRTCRDFRVPDEHITVLATEATRTAINSEDFRARIKDVVGWDVTMLPKEEEGRVGAMGIASSLPVISGLVMDLGGGSIQLSWLSRGARAAVLMPESGAVSMPYGAAAMTRRLAEAEKNGTIEELQTEVKRAFKDAYDSLKVPLKLKETAEEKGGFTLFLSGGGFRGWGYVLMSRHRVNPYPIPVINGFKATREEFMGTEDVKGVAATALQDEEDEIFRVSDRRASQVPAVAFLINILAEALPYIKEVRFCQGGVREGYLFSSLSPEVKAVLPLVAASEAVPARSSPDILKLLLAAVPRGETGTGGTNTQLVFDVSMVQVFSNLMYYHAGYSKDLQASAALRSTTSGILAGVHGIPHEERVLLALLLCSRWGGEVPPADETFKRNLERLVESEWQLWCVNYIGSVAGLIAAVFPAGTCGAGERERLILELSWDRSKKEEPILRLRIEFDTGSGPEMFIKEIKAIEKVGKKKNWIGGKGGIGCKVVVETVALPAGF